MDSYVRLTQKTFYISWGQLIQIVVSIFWYDHQGLDHGALKGGSSFVKILFLTKSYNNSHIF